MKSGTDAQIRQLPFGQAVKCALVMHTCPVSFWAVVERREMVPGISPVSLFRMALPWWAKYAAVAALLLAIWAHGAVWSANRAQAKAEALRAKQEAASLVRMQELAKRTDEITLVYLTQTRTIRERGQTIVREVPTYVTAEHDRACPTDGLIGVLNAAARHELPKPTISPDAAVTKPPANP